MKYDLTFTNAAGQRGTLTVRGPLCVAERAKEGGK